MPTSVLLAVLAAAGLLALAPALVRRYDAGERIAAERAASDARVLKRKPRKQAGPGGDPLEPGAHGPEDPAAAPDQDGDGGYEEPADSRVPDSGGRPGGWSRVGRGRATSVRLGVQQSSQSVGETDVVDNERRTWWRRRHRRILIGMFVLALGELVGVVLVGPGFWVGFGLSAVMLAFYVRYLRLRALAAGRTPHKALPPGTTPRRRLPRQPEGPLAESKPADGDERDPRWPREPPPVFYRPGEAAESEADDSYDDDAYDDDDTGGGTGPGDAPPAVEPPQRRRTGGIRGRSYESPAANV